MYILSEISILSKVDSKFVEEIFDALPKFPFMNGISDTRRSNQENTWVDNAVKDIRIDGNQIRFCVAIKTVHLKGPKLKIVDEVEDDCTNYHKTNSHKSSSSCYKISFSVSTRKIIIYVHHNKLLF